MPLTQKQGWTKSTLNYSLKNGSTDWCSRFILHYIALSVTCVSKKSDLTCTLDSCGELTLMLSASTCYTAGKDLCSVRSELVKLVYILVIDAFNFINAE